MLPDPRVGTLIEDHIGPIPAVLLVHDDKPLENFVAELLHLAKGIVARVITDGELGDPDEAELLRRLVQEVDNAEAAFVVVNRARCPPGIPELGRTREVLV